MLSKSLSLLLIAAMLFKPMAGLYMVIDYELNKDYIAKYLCQNKDKPELKCEGKCFLMQKLKKRNSENEAHKTKQLSQISKVEIMDVVKTTKMKFSKTISLVKFLSLVPFVKSEYIASVFRPPIS